MSVEDGEKKAKEYNVMFIETSAKAGYNVSFSRFSTFSLDHWLILLIQVKALFRKIGHALPGMETSTDDTRDSSKQITGF